MTIKIEEGVPLQKRQYEENETMYANGYAWGVSKRYVMTRAERNNIASLPCNDSYMEGVHDALDGKPHKYAN